MQAWLLLPSAAVGALAASWIYAQRTQPAHRALESAVYKVLEDATKTAQSTPKAASLPTQLLQRNAAQMDRIAVAESERQLLRSVLEAMEEGIVLLDDHSRVVLANRAAHELWFDRGPTLVGRHVLELLSNVQVDAAVSATLRDQEPRTIRIQEQEARGRILEVRVVAVDAVATPHRNADARGTLLIIADGTERQRIETMRRDFVANVSHELQTPLTSIQGFAETLEWEGTGIAPEQQARFVHLIRRETGRMVALVRDLMELARLEAVGTAQRSASVSIDELVRSIVDEFQPHAERKGITLVLVRPEGSQPVVRGNEDELRRATQNLVQNALQHTPANGRIEIGWSEGTPRQRLSLFVRDNGQGIAPEHLPRIFERFYRVDAGRSRAEGGTGLGLSIVKHIVESHGGDVTVESVVGQGSTFTIRLPLGNPASDTHQR